MTKRTIPTLQEAREVIRWQIRTQGHKVSQVPAKAISDAALEWRAWVMAGNAHALKYWRRWLRQQAKGV